MFIQVVKLRHVLVIQFEIEALSVTLAGQISQTREHNPVQFAIN